MAKPSADQVYKQRQDRIRRLRKLQADQQAAPPAERPKLARDIKLITEDIRKLDVELRRLAEDTGR